MKNFIFIFICLFILFSCFSKKVNDVSTNMHVCDSTYTIEHIELDSVYKETLDYSKNELDQMVMSTPSMENMTKQVDKINDDLDINISTKRIVDNRAPSSIINTGVNNDISNGKVLYHIPDKMKVGETKTVFLRISKSKSNLEIYENLNSNFLESNIRTSDAMSVELIDPSPEDRKMFYISKTNSQIQLVDSSYTEWIWSVKAIRSGDAKLKIVVKIASGNIVKETVYQSDIKIKINPSYQILIFIEKWWMWIITTIVIPIVTWYFKNRMKN